MAEEWMESAHLPSDRTRYLDQSLLTLRKGKRALADLWAIISQKISPELAVRLKWSEGRLHCSLSA